MKLESLSLKVIFFIFLAIYFFSGVGLSNSVDAPQYRLTQSIADYGRFDINHNLDYTWPDVVIINELAYSGRSPGESFLAIPFYLLSTFFRQYIVPPYNFGIEGSTNTFSGIESCTAIFNALAGATSVIVLFRLSELLCKDKKSSILTAVIFGLGTLMWKYSSTFYRHSPAVLFFLSSLYYFVLIVRKRGKRKNNFLMLNICLGFCYFIDPTLIIFILCLEFFLFLTKVINIKQVGLAFFIIIVINLPIFYYNQSVFGKFYKSGWEYQVVNSWLSDFSVAFSSPILPSIYINLFNPNKPISAIGFSRHLLSNEQLKQELSYYYATFYNYKGVFFQSPYLWLTILSLFLIPKTAIGLYGLSFLSVILQLKYLVYYSPNSYDTRFFLPFVAGISPLLSIFISKLKNFRYKGKKSYVLKLAPTLIMFFLFLVSIKNAWISNVENYAPHLTGEKRTSYILLYKDFTFKRLLLSTFPNLYNYKFLLIFILIVSTLLIINNLLPKKIKLSI